MSYELLQKLSLYSGIASAVMAVLSVVLFFWLDIPDVIGYFTGYNRRKGIEEIRKAAKAGTMDHRTGSKGRAAQKKGASTRAPKAPTPEAKRSPAPQAVESITDRLPNSVPAGSEQTTVLKREENLTTVLEQEEKLTTVLTEYCGTAPVAAEAAAVPFVIEFEITYLHSNEII